MTNGRFAGQVAIVTGAAQGIGEGVARALAAEGASLVLVDRSSLVQPLRESIGPSVAIAVEADLETYEGAEEVVAATLERFSQIDVLVNNVGGTIWVKPFEHYGPREIEAEVRRSLFPTLWCCRAVLPTMRAQRRGAIVNISSVATRGVNRVPYGAAKGGVNALTACLAFETATDGIRVNAVAPGGTEAPPRRVPRNAEAAPASSREQGWYDEIVTQTKQTSLMHRYGTIEEQVRAILFLASDEASYITGTVLPVAGGDLG